MIVALFTAAALVTAAILSWKGLAATAEGIGALSVVLVLLDAWAMRENNLFGLAAADGPAYWGVALLSASVLFLCWHALSRLRVASVAGFAVAAPGLGLLVAGLAAGQPDATRTYLAFLGTAVGALLQRFTLPGESRLWPSLDRVAERMTLLALGGLSLVAPILVAATLALALELPLRRRAAGPAHTALLAAAATAGGHGRRLRRLRRGRRRTPARRCRVERTQPGREPRGRPRPGQRLGAGRAGRRRPAGRPLLGAGRHPAGPRAPRGLARGRRRGARGAVRGVPVARARPLPPARGARPRRSAPGRARPTPARPVPTGRRRAAGRDRNRRVSGRLGEHRQLVGRVAIGRAGALLRPPPVRSPEPGNSPRGAARRGDRAHAGRRGHGAVGAHARPAPVRRRDPGECRPGPHPRDRAAPGRGRRHMGGPSPRPSAAGRSGPCSAPQHWPSPCRP